MKFEIGKQEQYTQIKKIYLEAFPKCERKPWFILRHSIKKQKAIIMTACEAEQLCGFAVLIPYQDMVMVDYLAVSSKIRSKGTGSYMLKKICERFSNKKIILLIEELDDLAINRDQRIARKKFYQKNGFISSQLFINGASGNMEILCYGKIPTAKEYLDLQKYALGAFFFKLSRIHLLDKSPVISDSISFHHECVKEVH